MHRSLLAKHSSSFVQNRRWLTRAVPSASSNSPTDLAPRHSRSDPTQEFLASGDKVVVIGHYGITQKKTGKHLESDWVHVFTFSGGKCTRWRELNDSAAFYKAYR